jgi:hypothetical protein
MIITSSPASVWHARIAGRFMNSSQNLSLRQVRYKQMYPCVSISRDGILGHQQKTSFHAHVLHARIASPLMNATPNMSLRQLYSVCISRYGILGHQFYKRFVSLALCYSYWRILKKPHSALVLKILTKKSTKEEKLSLFMNSIL